MSKKKEKTIVFNEKIDDAINGYAIGITFVLVSAFVFYKTDYFILPQVSYIVGSALGVLGILMCGSELSKSVKLKGIDNFFVGLFFVGIWWIFYCFFHDKVWVNVAIFLLLVIGCYGIIRGSIELVFSLISSLVTKTEQNNKTTCVKNVFLFLTQVFGLVLTFLNILKLLGIINETGT